MSGLVALVTMEPQAGTVTDDLKVCTCHPDNSSIHSPPPCQGLTVEEGWAR